LRKGAEEICWVLAVCVGQARAVCEPQGQAKPEPSQGQAESVRERA
jgi:hypothetical protein